MTNLDSRADQKRRKPPLSASIRNGTLLMLALTMVTGAFAVPATHKLGGSIREALHRNYLSIEAAQHMHAALYAAELNQLQGHAPAVVTQSRATFTHWINVELSDITEIGEGPLAHDIEARGQRIFAELSRNLPGTPSRGDFALLHQRLDDLIQMNQAAMFRADSRAMRMGDRLASEFALALVILLLIGVVISWTLARNVAKPLTSYPTACAASACVAQRPDWASSRSLNSRPLPPSSTAWRNGSNDLRNSTSIG